VENAGIDFWFLRHIGVEPETQRRIQGFYQRWFAECERVVDLACGDGDFLGLLREQGIEVLGVDSDPECCTAARARGVNATCQDVFDFLHAANESSYDGIFSAHLVEHLPYERVIELFRLAWRALKPGGVIVVTTPNVRGLYTHLESFYLHFGHVSFYHPELLCFFLKQSGFSNWEWGENPETAAPLWGCPTETSVVSFDRELPSRWTGMRGRLVHRLKRFLTSWLILPYLDQMVPQINRQLLQLGQVMKRLDRPVECYATAIKAPAGIASSAPEHAHQD